MTSQRKAAGSGANFHCKQGKSPAGELRPSPDSEKPRIQRYSRHHPFGSRSVDELNTPRVECAFVEREHSAPIALTLAQRVGEGAGAAQIAEAVASMWRDIDHALRPVLGQRGVSALYGRSLHLASPAYPWLAALHEGVPADIDLSALESALTHQGAADAAAGGGALLQTLHALLASLVGPSLTAQLLDPVWTFSSSALPAQDTSS